MNDARRLALEAIARGGTQGLNTFQQEAKAMQQSQNQALQGVSTDAPWNPPAASVAEMQQIVSVPGDRYKQALDFGATSHAGFIGRLNDATGSYMAQVAASEPLVRAAAEAEIAKSRQAAEQQGIMDAPLYAQKAYVEGEVARQRAEAERQAAEEEAAAARRRELAEKELAEAWKMRRAAVAHEPAPLAPHGPRQEARLSDPARKAAVRYQSSAREDREAAQARIGELDQYLAQVAEDFGPASVFQRQQEVGTALGMDPAYAAGLFPQPSRYDLARQSAEERQADYFDQTGFFSPSSAKEAMNAEQVLAYGPEAVEAADSLGIAPDEYLALRDTPDYAEAADLANEIVSTAREDEGAVTEDQLRQLLIGIEGLPPEIVEMVVMDMRPYLVGSESFVPTRYAPGG